ncbi:hypothetical protein F0U61_32995 [Archangium violaceum]|nr:hypothetical protein F0U61_32995 [Archangium violaceum]
MLSRPPTPSILPPQPAQAKTSKTNIRRSSPAQESRGVRSFLGSAFAAASGGALASCSFGATSVRGIRNGRSFAPGAKTP